MGGGGKAQAALGSDGRRWGSTGSGRKRGEAVKGHRQRWEEMECGGDAQAAVGSDGRRRRGTGSGRK